MSTFRNSKRLHPPVLRRVLLLSVVLSSLQSVMADDTLEAKLYKNPSCGCCEEYAKYLREYEYEVEVFETSQLEQRKTEFGIPSNLQSCHTMTLDGYVIEGHVPVSALDKLLSERPDVTGISLPGMPQGSPGMPGKKREPFVIHEFSDDESSVYVRD